MGYAFSFGGGVQSTAALVLAARGAIPYRAFVMANVGDDSENPLTLEYVRRIARPYASAHGLTLAIAEPRRTLWEEANEKLAGLPLFAGGGRYRRSCTKNHKVIPMHRAARRLLGARDLVVGIGISLDEWARAKDSRWPRVTFDFPLLDLKLTRAACRALITEEGLDVPPKSSCWFCPYQSPIRWAALAREYPDRYAAAADLEGRISERWGVRASFVSRGTLREGVPVAFDMGDGLDGSDGCDEGHCWT